ncbi:MAG: hypothetical protein HQL56_16400 [Magnetococcales bacterium]|nr:hypothetical protein [Magnetococcales bacterium]
MVKVVKVVNFTRQGVMIIFDMTTFPKQETGMADQALIKGGKLWAKTSQSGKPYLMGRLGGLRVLIFENREAVAEGENSNSHWLMFGAADVVEGAGQSRQGAARPQTQRGGGQPGQHSAGQRPSPAGQPVYGPGDDIPF